MARGITKIRSKKTKHALSPFAIRMLIHYDYGKYCYDFGPGHSR